MTDLPNFDAIRDDAELTDRSRFAGPEVSDLPPDNVRLGVDRRCEKVFNEGMETKNTETTKAYFAPHDPAKTLERIYGRIHEAETALAGVEADPRFTALAPVYRRRLAALRSARSRYFNLLAGGTDADPRTH